MKLLFFGPSLLRMGMQLMQSALFPRILMVSLVWE